MEDATLAAEAAQGDQRAFTILAERYRRYLYAIAYKIALNEDDALDAVQNAYARMVEKIGDYRGRGPFRAWAGQIAAREALNLLRHRSRRETPTDPHDLAALSDTRTGANQPSAREIVELDERRRLVREAMAGLSAQQRAVLALRLFEDMGPKEIAERLEMRQQQVRSQLHRAIDRVRRKLAGMEAGK